MLVPILQPYGSESHTQAPLVIVLAALRLPPKLEPLVIIPLSLPTLTSQFAEIRMNIHRSNDSF